MNVRWSCPKCSDTVIASSRPRKDDVRRYCLGCSAKTGRLVLRVAPVLERAREARVEKRKAKLAKEKAKADAKEAAYYTIDGVNLLDEMHRLLRAKTFKGPRGKALRANPPKLVVRRSKIILSTLGHANLDAHEVHVNTVPNTVASRAVRTLLHEIVHLYVGHRRGDGWHGVAFRNTFRLTAEEMLGEKLKFVGYSRFVEGHGNVVRADAEVGAGTVVIEPLGGLGEHFDDEVESSGIAADEVGS